MAPETRSVKLLIALILFKASGLVIKSSGLAAQLGVTPTTNRAPEEFAKKRALAEGTKASNPLEAFQTFLDFGSMFRKLFGLLFQADLLLVAAGIPKWLIVFVMAPVYLIIIRDGYYMLSSR